MERMKDAQSEMVDASGGRGDCPVWKSLSRRVPKEWPASWAIEYWKPKDRQRDLVRAGALIAAEIDRMQRESSNARGEAPPKAVASSALLGDAVDTKEV